MIINELPKRGTDQWGSGNFRASRGNRTHKGIDYSCDPGIDIDCPVDGVVTKLGYPYGDDLKFRYVEVSEPGGFRHRHFYVLPTVRVGDKIKRGDKVGEAQDIAGKYSRPDKTMTNHAHYEIKINSRYIDPEGLI